MIFYRHHKKKGSLHFGTMEQCLQFVSLCLLGKYVMNEFSYGFASYHLLKKFWGIDYKDMVSPLNEFSNDFSNDAFQKNRLDIGCKGMVSVSSLNECSYVSSNDPLLKKLLGIDYKGKVFHLNEFSNEPSSYY